MRGREGTASAGRGEGTARESEAGRRTPREGVTAAAPDQTRGLRQVPSCPSLASRPLFSPHKSWSLDLFRLTSSSLPPLLPAWSPRTRDLSWEEGQDLNPPRPQAPTP